MIGRVHPPVVSKWTTLFLLQRSHGRSSTCHLSHLIGASSHALDLTKVCRRGMRCVAAGCNSNAARLFELYRCDDQVVKRDFKQINSQSLVELGRFMIGHVGLGEPMRE